MSSYADDELMKIENQESNRQLTNQNLQELEQEIARKENGVKHRLRTVADTTSSTRKEYIGSPGSIGSHGSRRTKEQRREKSVQKLETATFGQEDAAKDITKVTFV